MNFSINFLDFSEINFTFITLIGGIFLILLGIVYYIIFHKHHKRNHIELFELVELVTKFYVRTILLVVLLAVSTYFIMLGVYLQEERSDTITCIVIAIIIASFSIISYRKYIKLSLIDYDMEIRAENNQRKLKVGEVLEVICFIICILAPIWRIPYFIEIFDDSFKLALEIIKSFAISIGGLILIFALNPMNIKRFFVEEKIEEPVKKKRGRPRKNPENPNNKTMKKQDAKSKSEIKSKSTKRKSQKKD